jgi:RNA recognition motif-containing protein
MMGGNPLARRIYVGSLDYSITPDIIKTLFSQFGAIVSVDMPIDTSYVLRPLH